MYTYGEWWTVVDADGGGPGVAAALLQDGEGPWVRLHQHPRPAQVPLQHQCLAHELPVRCPDFHEHPGGLREAQGTVRVS